ncbi:hypothetical protein [Coleofasciculus chthonoplastes]|uniref:hypothetical protein n=1 Tax=Coleofasciculus chthonoplastes TaxID=64178 RepID=UPI003304BED3
MSPSEIGARASANRLVAGMHWLSDHLKFCLYTTGKLWLSQFNHEDSGIKQ